MTEQMVSTKPWWKTRRGVVAISGTAVLLTICAAYAASFGGWNSPDYDGAAGDACKAAIAAELGKPVEAMYLDEVNNNGDRQIITGSVYVLNDASTETEAVNYICVAKNDGGWSVSDLSVTP